MSHGLPGARVFGGELTTRGIGVWTDNGTGSNFVDETDDAQSASGSTFTTQGTTSNQATIYILSSLGKFSDLEITLTVVAVLGSGTFIAEVWTGAAWQPINFMVIDLSTRVSLGRELYTEESIAVLFDTSDANYANWAQNDPGTGTTAHHLRLRNAGTITSGPTIEQVKTGFSRTVWDSAGRLTRYGDAIQDADQIFAHGDVLVQPSGSGGSQLTSSISSNVSLRTDRGLLTNGSDRASGAKATLPPGLDTSRPFTLTIAWYTSNTNTGAIDATVTVSLVHDGDTLGALSEQSDGLSISGSGTANEVAYLTKEFSFPAAVPTDILSFLISRAGATDAHTGDVGLFKVWWSGKFWK